MPGRSALIVRGSDNEPRQATQSSSGIGRGILRVLQVPLLLIGPLMVYAAAFLATSESTVNRWILAGAGVGVAIYCVRLTLSEARLDARARQDHRRLEAVGVAATAEITAVRPTSLGEESGIELSLLISGYGFEPFESASQCKEHPSLRVGARLNAVVDPANRLYAIVP